ncbi:MAG: hydrogenase small subunit [bacterium]
MPLTRRRFLQLCAGSTAALGFSGTFIPKLVEALTKAKDTLPVIWIGGQTCTGCSVSLLNTVHPSIAEVLTEIISLQFHAAVMASSGDLALSMLDQAKDKLNGKYVLAVGGSIPTNDDGLYCTIGEKEGHPVTVEHWVRKLGSSATAVLAIGTCASFGGIPAAPPNPTGAKSVSEILPGKTIINIPGCPPHPDWMVGTIAHVVLYGLPSLDAYKRPTMFFGSNRVIHDNCERRAYFDEGKFARDLSEEYCLYELGCKGPVTNSDCSIRSWNNGVNWCVQAGAPCIGCCSPDFPGQKTAGFYNKLPEIKLPGVKSSANQIGAVAAGAAAGAIALHGLGRVLTQNNRKEGDE